MQETNASEEWVAPIFILADPDREAVDTLLERLHPEWCYIPVREPHLVVNYAKLLAVTAVFLADPIEAPRGGAAQLLQELLDEVGKPTIIMAEDWSPEIKARWLRLGAADCIPHPTRFSIRLEGLRTKMEELALARVAERRRAQ